MPLTTLRGTEAIARFNRITCKITKKRKELMIAREEIEWIDWESNRHKQHTAHSFPIIRLFLLAWTLFVFWLASKFCENFEWKFLGNTELCPHCDHWSDRDVKVGKKKDFSLQIQSNLLYFSNRQSSLLFFSVIGN